MRYLLLFLVFNFSLSGFAQKVILDENFDVDNTNWVLEKNKEISFLLEKGNYVMTPISDGKYWSTTVYEKFNIDEDFVLETSIMVKAKPGTNYGFIWNKGSNYEVQIIFSDNSVKIEKIMAKDKSSYVLMDWKKLDVINKSNYNKIKIEKKANLIYYYINDVLLYQSCKNQPKNFYAKG